MGWCTVFWSRSWYRKAVLTKCLYIPRMHNTMKQMTIKWLCLDNFALSIVDQRGCHFLDVLWFILVFFKGSNSQYFSIDSVYGVSNHTPHDWLLNRLFRRRSKKTSKLSVTGLCEGNSPVTGEFPAQRTSNAKNVSIWWRHHVMPNLWDEGKA